MSVYHRYKRMARTAEEYAEAERIRRILKTARKELGYKQADVAKKLGIEQSGYSIIERDFMYTSGYKQKKICEILGLKWPEILKE